MRWKAVPGYEGRYSVCEDGRILSNLTNRVLSPGTNSKGYHTVSLFDGSRPKASRSLLVHRLVMAAFVGPCPERQQVNHINGIKTDNRLENLEYCTASENNLHAECNGLGPKRYRGRHSKNSKLTEEDVRVMKRGLAVGMPVAAVARAYWVDPTLVEDIRDGRWWKHVPDEKVTIEAA